MHIVRSLKYPKYASYIESIAHCACLDRGLLGPILEKLCSSLTAARDAALNARRLCAKGGMSDWTGRRAKLSCPRISSLTPFT